MAFQMDSEGTFRHKLTEEDCHTMSVGGEGARVQDGIAINVCYSTTRPTGHRQSKKIHVPGLHGVNNGTQLSTLIT